MKEKLCLFILLGFVVVTMTAATFYSSAAQDDSYSYKELPPMGGAKQGPATKDITGQGAAVEDVIDYCQKLPEAEKPYKGCKCLYNAYEARKNKPQVTSQEQSNYETWLKVLKENEQKIIDTGGQGALIATQNFCSDYYDSPETIQISKGLTRDRAVMKPKINSKEDHTAFINLQRELQQSTGGAAAQYCRAFIEVGVYKRLLGADPFAGLSAQDIYRKLFGSPYCMFTR